MTEEINKQVAQRLGWLPNSWGLYPRPTTDPEAAEMLRKEIASRWDYNEGRYGSSLFFCHITGDQQGRDEWSGEHQRPFVARCLAFINAWDGQHRASTTGLIEEALSDLLDSRVKESDAPSSAMTHFNTAVYTLKSLVPYWEPKDTGHKAELEFALGEIKMLKSLSGGKE